MNKLAKLDRLLQALLCGLLLWIPLLAIAALAWPAFAPDRLYHCWDDIPFVTCIPPFVHPWANSGALVDYYIWPAWTVYSLWFGLIVLTLIVPTILAWLVFRPWYFDDSTGNSEAQEMAGITGYCSDSAQASGPSVRSPS